MELRSRGVYLPVKRFNGEIPPLLQVANRSLPVLTFLSKLDIEQSKEAVQTFKTYFAKSRLARRPIIGLGCAHGSRGALKAKPPPRLRESPSPLEGVQEQIHPRVSASRSLADRKIKVALQKHRTVCNSSAQLGPGRSEGFRLSLSNKAAKRCYGRTAAKKKREFVHAKSSLNSSTEHSHSGLFSSNDSTLFSEVKVKALYFYPR